MEERDFVDCPAHKLFKLFRGKFTLAVLVQIFHGTDHFGQLLRNIPNINSRILAKRLRFLEEEGLIARRILASNPPMSIQYHLTEKGLALRKIILEMNNWQKAYEN